MWCNLNVATPSLQYVSGISTAVARNIVKYRDENGKFKNRKELFKIKRLGDKTFEQCAGFLRITDGTHPLDNTAVHPESYETTMELIKKLSYTTEDIKKGNLKNIEAAIFKYTGEKIECLNEQIKILAKELNIGELTLKDIIEELKKPGRDPREEMPKPIFRSDVLDMEDLNEYGFKRHSKKCSRFWGICRYWCKTGWTRSYFRT